jgi:hypothetical protein
MKLSSIFNLVTDGQDVLDLFDGVDNVDQLRGRLRRLSQLEADDLLTCLDGLRTSVAALLRDTLEVSPNLPDLEDLGDDLEGAPDIDRDLEDVAAGDPTAGEGEEDQSTGVPAPAEK